MLRDFCEGEDWNGQGLHLEIGECAVSEKGEAFDCRGREGFPVRFFEKSTCIEWIMLY